MSNTISTFDVQFKESSSQIPLRFDSGSGGGGGGNYERLQQKPKINNVELVGNKTSADLGIADAAAINMILSLITGIEQSMTATKAYGEHDLVIIGNELYEVTAAIASGSSFVIGTNCKVTTLGESISSVASRTAILG